MEGLCSLHDTKVLLPIEDHWAISKMRSTDQILAVAKTILSGNATQISNGSFKNNRGTVACIVEANNDTNSRIYAMYDTPGNKIDQSPYRSELGRISMVLLILQCVIRCHSIKLGSVQVGLDGKQAMEQTKGKFPLYPK